MYVFEAYALVNSDTEFLWNARELELWNGA